MRSDAPLRVCCRDGEAGWVKEIVIDPSTGQPSRLIVRLPGAEGPEVAVAMRRVAEIGEDHVRLNATLEELGILAAVQRRERLPAVNAPEGTR